VPGAQLFSNFSNLTVQRSQTTSPFEYAYDDTREYGVGVDCAE